jgi:hypothetical protein
MAFSFFAAMIVSGWPDRCAASKRRYGKLAGIVQTDRKSCALPFPGIAIDREVRALD